MACKKQFLLFSQCFLPFMVLSFHFKCTVKCRLQFVSIWTSVKFCHLVMGRIRDLDSELGCLSSIQGLIVTSGVHFVLTADHSFSSGV